MSNMEYNATYYRKLLAIRKGLGLQDYINDKDVIIEAIKHGNITDNKLLLNDKDVIITVVQNINNLEYFKGNIQQYFKNIDEKFRNDKDVIIEFVKKDNYMFELINNKFKNDKDIILAALAG
jgi:hypothetical protein